MNFCRFEQAFAELWQIEERRFLAFCRGTDEGEEISTEAEHLTNKTSYGSLPVAITALGVSRLCCLLRRSKIWFGCKTAFFISVINFFECLVAILPSKAARAQLKCP